jgi:predicted nucleic acid-binding protein
MKRVFLDSSVLFSAAYSRQGESRNLVLMAIREEIIVVTSQIVIEETRRNLAEFAPAALIFLEYAIENIPFELVEPTKREVLDAGKHTVLKDAPIAAAAKKARVDMLVTLDKKHLLGKPGLAEYIEADIIRPSQAVKLIRE